MSFLDFTHLILPARTHPFLAIILSYLLLNPTHWLFLFLTVLYIYHGKEFSPCGELRRISEYMYDWAGLLFLWIILIQHWSITKVPLLLPPFLPPPPGGNSSGLFPRCRVLPTSRKQKLGFEPFISRPSCITYNIPLSSPKHNHPSIHSLLLYSTP